MDSPTAPDTAAEDLALLRRFEPVLRLTAGEMFLPTAVEDYLQEAQLLSDAGTPLAQILAERGELDPGTLSEAGRTHGEAALSLRYVARPMGLRDYRAWLRGGGREPFRPISRAAAVGLLSRLIAALMQLSLLVRGRVPGGWTAAAAEQSRANAARRTTYYGRVTRDAGYIALQYWFLYPMNDWRSSFGGVNDHEADWEQVTVFLVDGVEPEPVWVAFSSHDEEGADLRRRWDDPDLGRVGEHPVVFVGAGSHSGAYLPGEYLVTVRPDVPRWVAAAQRQLVRLFGSPGSSGSGVGIPYLDYRRGDGMAIGPGQDLEWDAHVIDDDTPWVRDFRGLWGLDTRDRFGGERAPAGPRYERDGRVRESWRQPVAWADLDGVPPTAAAAAALWAGREEELRRRSAELAGELDEARSALRAASIAAATGSATTSTAAVADARRRVEALRREEAVLVDALEDAGRFGGRQVAVAHPHAHLAHRALPLAASSGSPVLGVWAALSAALLMATLGGLLVANPTHLIAWSAVVIAAMVALEAVLRGRLFSLVTRVVVTAGVLVVAVATVALMVENLRLATGILLLASAGYLLFRAVSDATGQWIGQRASRRHFG